MSIQCNDIEYPNLIECTTHFFATIYYYYYFVNFLIYAVNKNIEKPTILYIENLYKLRLKI